ncbi:MAG: calcium/sodium antiporter [Hyphomonadaceae bacterium]|nr:calcium/sodium antiporter [Hyphomonadaceae bacterium]
MDWFPVAASLAGGLVLLALGGEFVVRGAVGVARKFGISELMIGLTLVGFGTSSPELAASINAALAGSPGIAVGNVVGSNISNVLLIFALVAIVRPITVDPKALQRDGWVMLLATLVFIAAAVVLDEFSRLTGAAFVAALIGYLVFTYFAERKSEPAARIHEADAQLHEPKPAPLWRSGAIAIVGLVMLVFGADLLIGGAKTVARAAGMSETIIGLTIVALGTSLPELVTSVMAALKGRSDVAFGGIIGSNIYNILGIIGITALVQPIAVPVDLLARDWAALYVATLLIVLHANTGGRVNRLEGGFLLLHYVGYCWLLLN